MRVVAKALADPVFADLMRFETSPADESTYLYAHPEAYVSNLRAQSPDEGRIRLDPDTAMSPKTWEAVSHAVGGGLAAVDAD